MRLRGWMVCLLGLFVVVGAGAMGWMAPSVVGQEELSKGLTTRYRVTVVRLAVPEDSTGQPLLISEFGREVPGALVARSDSPGLSGHWGAVPDQKDMLRILKQRGLTMEVVYSGEMESGRGRKGTVTSGQKFPVRSVEVRGEQLYVTTKFEQVGTTVELERGAVGDDHDISLSMSAVTAHGEGRDPVIFQVSMRGRMTLPDGYTAVYSFLDRVEGAFFLHTPESLSKGGAIARDIPPDLVAQYFVLLTRMDLKY